MNKLITFFLISLTVLLSGCSSTPTPIQEAVGVDSSRIFQIEPLKNPNSYAKLKILRDQGLNGANQNFEVWINGEIAAKIKVSELYEVKLNPGVNIIEVRMHNILGKISPAQVETILSEGKTYFYRTGFNANSAMLTLTRDISLSR